ncbi:hypothetical protein IT41_01395 [Paracoccus halophilus]|uniref:Uncharacterized protein n=1 Tax=Paracoccus halophilus TaxID=376733 RepID=A0A099F821_9RHOB|nr:hypothetical protein IT41_01395 [Paracoccus halophilus]
MTRRSPFWRETPGKGPDRGDFGPRHDPCPDGDACRVRAMAQHMCKTGDLALTYESAPIRGGNMTFRIAPRTILQTKKTGRKIS